MSVHYFARETDSSGTVYEVDFAAGTWRIFGSDDDRPNAKGRLIDGGSSFYSVYFARLDLVEDCDDTVTFMRAGPTTIH